MKNKLTAQRLISHYNQYPNQTPTDMFKYIYQSTFGCEHMVSSLESCADNIANEYKAVLCAKSDFVEPLDGDFSRINLKILSEGISANTLGALFYLSSKEPHSTKEALEDKISILSDLVDKQIIPFDMSKFHGDLIRWKNSGYPSLHHSNIFRETYHPHYRVISNKFIKFLPLFIKIDTLLSLNKLTVAIEGGSASGKTTLAALLSELYDCNLLHTDDFFLRPEQRTKERFSEIGGNIDRERFYNEVIVQLNKNESFSYRPFDCSSFALAGEKYVKPKNLTVIEGVYSMHPYFEKYYDLSVFIDVPKEMQKQRILKRNSPEMAKRFFNEWIPLEDIYFEHFNIKSNSDIIIEL